MAAVDHPPQEKVDEQVKIQLPGFAVSFWFGKLARGTLYVLFCESTQPDLFKTPKNS